MRTVRLTTAEAVVRLLLAQQTVVDGRQQPLFGGVFAIFGHGNVTCLGPVLEQVQDRLPTWRAQNEQGMALAAVGYARAHRGRRAMVATSSIGPGATNMVTAAAVAHANRLPLLLLAGDTFASRIPDPVLQQVEDPSRPGDTVNDAFRPVTRYWDRITRPEQVCQSLPAAFGAMFDPAGAGPAFVGLAQDVQGETFDYPERLFEPVVHTQARPRPDRRELDTAVSALIGARAPLVVAGGGVRHSGAETALGGFAEAHRLPVVETMAGRSCLVAGHPCNAGPIGVTGSGAANALAAEADVVLAVGTRLADFTTGSWTVFADDDLRLVGLNTARFDATKHRSLPLVADAAEGLRELDERLAGWRGPEHWATRARALADEDRRSAGVRSARPNPDPPIDRPTYAQVVGAVNRTARPDDYVVSAAGGLPGELNANWTAPGVGTFDCEYGFSCMGYEIAGAWGAKMAMPDREVVALVGDGSYLMLNGELYSSVLSGHKLTVVVCDNGGYAVIDRLQVAQGGVSFNNLLADCRTVDDVRVDFVAHAASMGCEAEEVDTVAGLEAALDRARSARRTSVVVIRTAPHAWSEGGSFWEVGVPEMSPRPEVEAARRALEEAKQTQRVGW